MHIIDQKRFQKALKQMGYKSIGELAKKLCIHRNSIHYYLSGKSVFPEVVEKIIEALKAKPEDIIIKKEDREKNILEEIAPLVDTLHSEFPDVTFVLFGSRAKGSAQKYSDWDIGVFSQNGLEHEKYRNIIKRKNALIEDMPYFVDIVNLNNADEDFLIEISKHWIFLSGIFSDWLLLQRKAVA